MRIREAQPADKKSGKYYDWPEISPAADILILDTESGHKFGLALHWLLCHLAENIKKTVETELFIRIQPSQTVRIRI